MLLDECLLDPIDGDLVRRLMIRQQEVRAGSVSTVRVDRRTVDRLQGRQIDDPVASVHETLYPKRSGGQGGSHIAQIADRHHVRGEWVNTMCKLGTFSEHTVVSEASVIKIDED